MKCNENCQYYGFIKDTDDIGCSCPTEKISDLDCLLRRLLWAVYSLEEKIVEQTELLQEDDEGDDWKSPA